MSEQFSVGPRTKGLRLAAPRTSRAVLDGVTTVDGEPFALPMLTLEDTALRHNCDVLAASVAAAGEAAGVPGTVRHAPHVKTHMSAQLWERQRDAGAWGVTVANAHQLRAVRDWGVTAALVANEVTDPADLAWIVADLERDAEAQVLLQVDSVPGARALAAAAGSPAADRIGVLVEWGVPGGRTGVRTAAEGLAVARALREGGIAVAGVTGYEGPVAAHTDPASLAAVAAWIGTLRGFAAELVAAGLLTGRAVLSAGGSAFTDVVLGELPGPLAGLDEPPLVLVRPGSYLVHDHVHYTELDPFARIPGAAPLIPAATVHAPVLSAPEPGLVLLGVGRRDVPYDLDLPVPLWRRTRAVDGSLGPREPLDAVVTDLNDQHAFVRTDAPLGPGDVVGLGISHPCTLFDKWRVGVVVDGDRPLELIAFDL